MEDKVYVSEAIAADVSSIMRIYNQMPFYSDVETEKDYQELVRGETVIVFKNDKQEVIGFTSFYPRINFIHLFCFDEASRNKGYGKRLIMWLVDDILDGKVELLCAIDNSACCFYTKIGFKNCGLVKGIQNDCIKFTYDSNQSDK